MHGMRPFGELLPKEVALATLLAAARPLTRTEDVPLAEARDRACAEDVRAPIDVPPFARATMDGYAVRASDMGPRRVVGEVFAGARDLPRVGAGEAARIATGAPVPEDADAVVRVEDTSEKDGVVVLAVAPRTGQNIDGAGSDVAKGALLVARGTPLTPARLGLLASVGRARVVVVARPEVLLISSGDELLSPGAPPDPRRVFDSNGASVGALLAAAGAVVRTLRVRDEKVILRAALRERADLVVVTGGASVGVKDLLVDALDERILHGVRVKPGKPLLVGRAGANLVVGLPGNPTSALSNAALFVAPAVRQIAGLAAEDARTVEAELAAAVVGEPARYLFLPVKLDGGRAVPTFKGSGALTSMAASDGWIGVDEGAKLAAGARVRVTLW